MKYESGGMTIDLPDLPEEDAPIGAIVQWFTRTLDELLGFSVHLEARAGEVWVLDAQRVQRGWLKWGHTLLAYGGTDSAVIRGLLVSVEGSCPLLERLARELASATDEPNAPSTPVPSKPSRTAKRRGGRGWRPCSPGCVGWAMFDCESSEHGRFRVQRCDECGRFETDEDAVEHVGREAKRLARWFGPERSPSDGERRRLYRFLLALSAGV
jgi:hypothetical protein